MRTMQPDARCALLALAFVAGSSVNAADIAFVNGGFELTDVGPDGVPVGWMLDALTPPERVGVDALRVHAGARAFRITDEQPDKGYAIHSDFYPAVPGETYRTTARVYNGIGDGWLYLEFYADPRNRVAETHAGCLKEGAWEQIVIEQPCPPEARYVVALLYSSGANVGQSSWDDVTLEGPQGEGEILSRDRNEAPKVDYSYLYDVGDSKQLLFDDAFLESHEGFWWRVCPPRKTGERNVVADRPWEDFIVNAWCTVMEDGGRYRMWYEAYDKSYKSDYDARYCYAESDDGIHWEKPSLGLVEFDGSKDNNILFGKLDGAAVHGGTVFMDPTASAEERYKFFFLSDGAIWAGLSPDGIHWTRRADGPVLDVPSDTQSVCFWDERIEKYVAYCRLWTRQRTVGRSESDDFFSFPAAREVLACDEKDPDDMDLYNNAAIKYPYAENAYLIFTSAYHHEADNLDVQLAVSRDGVSWSRPERRPFIPNGEPGAMDDATVYCGVGVLEAGDEMWMYYHASTARHNQVYPRWLDSNGVLTRAVLRLDGYVAMVAGVVPSKFTTHALTFTGDRLELNADVRPGGYVKLELRDADDAPIPGFMLDDCVQLEGDSVRHVAAWKAGSDVSALAGKKIRLYCEAKDASLYAFQFAPTGVAP